MRLFLSAITLSLPPEPMHSDGNSRATLTIVAPCSEYLPGAVIQVHLQLSSSNDWKDASTFRFVARTGQSAFSLPRSSLRRSNFDDIHQLQPQLLFTRSILRRTSLLIELNPRCYCDGNRSIPSRRAVQYWLGRFSDDGYLSRDSDLPRPRARTHFARRRSSRRWRRQEESRWRERGCWTGKPSRRNLFGYASSVGHAAVVPAAGRRSSWRELSVRYRSGRTAQRAIQEERSNQSRITGRDPFQDSRRSERARGAELVDSFGSATAQVQRRR